MMMYLDKDSLSENLLLFKGRIGHPQINTQVGREGLQSKDLFNGWIGKGLAEGPTICVEGLCFTKITM